MIFKPGTYTFKDDIIILVGKNGDPFVVYENYPLIIQTSDFFNINNWKKIE